MKKYKFAIIGAGKIALPHKMAVLQNERSTLCAICDTAVERARALAEDTDARIYASYEDMAKNEELDAVIINLPHFLHCPVSVYFLKKGISVLVEKPMANTVSECEKMQLAAEESGACLAIGHMQRYLKCYQEIKRLIKEKQLGELCQVTESRNVDYFTGRPDWFVDKEKAGGGIVMNYCAHTLDKLFYTVDSPIDRVYANVDNKLNDANVEAQAQVLIRMENGVSAAFSYSAGRHNSSYETVFYFTDGVAKVASGRYLDIAKKGEQFARVDLDYTDTAISEQFCEFIKLLDRESANIVDAKRGKEIISVIERIYKSGNE